jgi:hypothetical protein
MDIIIPTASAYVSKQGTRTLQVDEHFTIPVIMSQTE